MNKAVEKIGNNETMQKNLDAALKATRKALKNNFHAYAKMVQADVIAEILKDSTEEVPATHITEAAKLINEMMSEQGKYIEKTVEENIKAEMAKLAK